MSEAEVCVIVNSTDCTGQATSWTVEDFERLSQMFKSAAEAMRRKEHILLNCDDPDPDPEQFPATFCSISLRQPYGGEQYVIEFGPPGMLDQKKLIRERNKRMGGRKFNG